MPTTNSSFITLPMLHLHLWPKLRSSVREAPESSRLSTSLTSRGIIQFQRVARDETERAYERRRIRVQRLRFLVWKEILGFTGMDAVPELSPIRRNNASGSGWVWWCGISMVDKPGGCKQLSVYSADKDEAGGGSRVREFRGLDSGRIRWYTFGFRLSRSTYCVEL